MQKRTLKDELVTRGLWGEFLRTRAEVSRAGYRLRDADIETLVRMGMDRTLERFVKPRRRLADRVDVEDIGNDERARDALPDRPLDPLRDDGEKAGGKAGGGRKAKAVRKEGVKSPRSVRVDGLVADGRMTWDVPESVWKGKRCSHSRAFEWVVENVRTRIADDDAANALLNECPSRFAWSILAEARDSDRFRQGMMLSILKISEKNAEQETRREDDFDGREQYDLVVAMRKTGVIA